MFRAPGGIARVSRHYLQAIAGTVGPSAVSLVVLNDDRIGAADLRVCEAEGADATGCNRAKGRCAWELWRRLRGGQTHVTCTHVALSALLPWLQRLGCRFTYDVVVHGIEVWQPLPRSQVRSLTGARKVFSVSDYTRRELVGRYPQLSSHCHVLPNALDPSFATSHADGEEHPGVAGRILAVSRLAAHDTEKGIDHLIRALPTIRQALPQAHLRIVGRGVDEERLRAIAREIPEPEAVSFLGQLTDEDLRNEFSDCELFALPSRKEGFGLVYLEAMAAGKPCIVADAGGAPEVIDEASGVVVPYGEVDALARAVIAALKKQWRAETIQRRAHEFSFPAFAERWRSLSSLKL